MKSKARKRRKRNPDSIPALTKKLDKVFSRWVRLSAMDARGYVKCYTCEYRNVVAKMQCGHYVPRQYKATRWEPMNCRPQCYACNVHYGGRPQEFRERLILEYSEEDVLWIESARHVVEPLDRFVLKEDIERYTALVAEME